MMKLVAIKYHFINNTNEDLNKLVNEEVYFL